MHLTKGPTTSTNKKHISYVLHGRTDDDDGRRRRTDDDDDGNGVWEALGPGRGLGAWTWVGGGGRGRLTLKKDDR